jgi:hypothetical protein
MINLLVEPMIYGKYKKFTDNYGANEIEVKRDFAEENSGVDLNVAAALLGRKYNETTALTKQNSNKPGLFFAGGGLGAIVEGDSDDEDDDSGSDNESESSQEESNVSGQNPASLIEVSMLQPEDFLHAFSHFTYVRSGGRFMVVDLQGAFQIAPDGKKTFLLTDPAIHYKFKDKRDSRRKDFGRTNLGRKGMRAFFETHKCNVICRLFGFRDKSNEKDLNGICRRYPDREE